MKKLFLIIPLFLFACNSHHDDYQVDSTTVKVDSVSTVKTDSVKVIVVDTIKK